MNENNKPMASSLQVAKHFVKRHADVLKAIENLKFEMPESLHERNFAPMFIDVKIGNGATRQDEAYMLTRDGFTMLSMGFTGKKAVEWKLKYLEAFNTMEKDKPLNVE